MARFLMAITVAVAIALLGGACSLVESGLFEADTNSMLYIDNPSDVDLVFFAGSVAGSSLMGGVKAGQTGHRLKVPGFTFGQTNSKIMLINAIRYSDYQKDTNNPSQAEILFSAMAYLSDTETHLKVSAYIGGDAYLKFINNGSSYLDVRGERDSGSWNSPTIALLSAQETKIVAVKAGNYHLYPVVKLDQYSSIVEVKITNYITNIKIVKNETNMLTFDDYTRYMAVLRINNNSGRGVQIHSGATLLSSKEGNKGINPSSSLDFVQEGYDSNNAPKPITLKAQLENGVSGVLELGLHNGKIYYINITTNDTNLVLTPYATNDNL